MSQRNCVKLTGNLGADPELRYTGAGTAVSNFRLATNDYYRNQQGERVQNTQWHRLVAWGQLAELVNKHCYKGRLVQITGHLQTRKWTDRDGAQRETTEVHVNEVDWYGAAKAGAESTSSEVAEDAKSLEQEVGF